MFVWLFAFDGTGRVCRVKASVPAVNGMGAQNERHAFILQVPHGVAIGSERLGLFA